MPVARTHRAAGMIVGAGAAFGIIYLVNNKMIPAALVTGTQIDPILYTFLAGFCGLVGGLLPDILEPSSRGPRHRGIFHSFFFLAGLVLIDALIVYGKILPSPEQFFLRNIIFFIVVGYISHLILDGLLTLWGR
jgi:membrane-bound metal-dependent hydrolase YbcI (DUF457 family)